MFASCVLLVALTFTAVAVNRLLKLLRESLVHHPVGNWLTNHESSLLLSAWAAVIAALFFFGPRLILFITSYANAMLA